MIYYLKMKSNIWLKKQDQICLETELLSYRVLHHKPVESIALLELDRMKYTKFKASTMVKTKVHFCP